MLGDPLADGREVRHGHAAHWVWKNLAVVVLAIVAVGGTYLAVQVQNNSKDAAELAQQNTERIQDIDHESRVRDSQIQRTRVKTCRLIYGSFPKVFNPLLPPPQLRDDVTKQKLQRFRAVIQGLQDSCPRITKPGRAP